MNVHTNNNGRVMWQTQVDYMSEPALLITGNSDTICVEQEGRCILLNYESLDEFIKLLKEAKKNRPK